MRFGCGSVVELRLLFDPGPLNFCGFVSVSEADNDDVAVDDNCVFGWGSVVDPDVDSWLEARFDEEEGDVIGSNVDDERLPVDVGDVGNCDVDGADC